MEAMQRGLRAESWTVPNRAARLGERNGTAEVRRRFGLAPDNHPDSVRSVAFPSHKRAISPLGAGKPAQERSKCDPCPTSSPDSDASSSPRAPSSASSPSSSTSPSAPSPRSTASSIATAPRSISSKTRPPASPASSSTGTLASSSFGSTEPEPASPKQDEPADRIELELGGGGWADKHSWLEVRVGGYPLRRLNVEQTSGGIDEYYTAATLTIEQARELSRELFAAAEHAENAR